MRDPADVAGYALSVTLIRRPELLIGLVGLFIYLRVIAYVFSECHVVFKLFSCCVHSSAT